MPTREAIIHPLPPIFNEDSTVLILGTMPSPVSRRQAFYYANPQNRFWRVLCAVLQEGYTEDNKARRALCLSHRIALWDIIKSCTIEGASDSSIRNAVPNDISSLIGKTRIRAVFTTGKTAGRLYTRFCEDKTGIKAVVLPSPSGANCAVSLERLIESYREILKPLF